MRSFDPLTNFPIVTAVTVAGDVFVVVTVVVVVVVGGGG